MKKILLLALAVLLTAGGAQAQDSFYSTCNRWSLAAGVGTEGVGFEVATNFNKYLALRAGLNIMPAMTTTATTNVDLSAADPRLTELGYPTIARMDLEASLSRTSVDLKLDYYPAGGKFFITGGFTLGGKTLAKVKGHSQDIADAYAKYGDMAEQYGVRLTDSYIEVDKYRIPVDRNGNVSGGLEAASFRPYLGLGFGRAVPKKRVGCRVELGVQFHGTPSFYIDNGNFDEITRAAEDDVSEVIDFVEGITVYPVLKFTLRGRIL